MRMILLLISWAFCFQALASTLSLIDASAPRAWMNNGVTAQAVADSPSGDGTSSSAPTTVYFPINSGSNSNYSILSDPSNQMLKYNTGTSAWEGNVYIEMNVNNTGGNATTLYAAVQDTGTTYKLIEIVGEPIAANNDIDLNYNFSMYDFCNVASCSNATITTLDRLVFFFLSETQPASSFTVDSKTGLYFKLRFSSVIPTAVPVLESIRKGDERLNLFYSSAPVLADYYETLVFSYTNTTATATADTYSSIRGLGSIISNSAGTSNQASGYYTLKDLDNERNYNVSIAFADKFQFASKFSGSRIAVPEKIEVFLEKQGCYLLSAGFQEEHYVLEYFKKFRDQVLLKHALGKKFVHFYYSTAPQYTHYIYNSPMISSVVRGAAYTLYFIFNYFSYILFSLMGLFFLFVFHYLHKAYRQA